MWCLYPFLEVNAHDEDLYAFAFQHYYQELTNVLETFGNTLGDHQLPENLADFRSLIRRGFVLEFLIVTVLRPLLSITSPEVFLSWHKNLLKYEKRVAKGGLYRLFSGKQPKLPEQEQIFQNPRYLEFLQFYFKIATSLGAFQELGLVYFELMKDAMFGEGKLDGFESDLPPKKPKIFSREWFTSTFFSSCMQSEGQELLAGSKKEMKKAEKTIMPREDMIYADEEEIVKEQVDIESKKVSVNSLNKVESIYEPVRQDPVPVDETILPKLPLPPEEPPRPPTPDPLRALAAQLHASFVDYKETFAEFKDLMDRNANEPMTQAEEDSVNEIFENNVYVPRETKEDDTVADNDKKQTENSKRTEETSDSQIIGTDSKFVITNDNISEVHTQIGIMHIKGESFESSNACSKDDAKHLQATSFQKAEDEEKLCITNKQLAISKTGYINDKLETPAQTCAFKGNTKQLSEDCKNVRQPNKCQPVDAACYSHKNYDEVADTCFRESPVTKEVKSRKAKVEEIVSQFSLINESQVIELQTNASSLLKNEHHPNVCTFDGNGQENLAALKESIAGTRLIQGNGLHLNESNILGIQEKKEQETDSLDYRKDSFCSDVSRQDLIDILDQDEASWVKRDENVYLECRKFQETSEDNKEIKTSLVTNFTHLETTNANKDDGPAQTEVITSFNSDVASVSSNKQSILSWLKLAQTDRCCVEDNMQNQKDEGQEDLNEPPKSLFELLCDGDPEEDGYRDKSAENSVEKIAGLKETPGKFFPLEDLDAKYKPFGEVRPGSGIMLGDSLSCDVDIFSSGVHQDSVACSVGFDHLPPIPKSLYSTENMPHLNAKICTTDSCCKPIHTDHGATDKKKVVTYSLQKSSNPFQEIVHDELHDPEDTLLNQSSEEKKNKATFFDVKLASNLKTDKKSPSVTKQHSKFKQNNVSFKEPTSVDPYTCFSIEGNKAAKTVGCTDEKKEDCFTGEGNTLLVVQKQNELSSTSSQICEEIKSELFYICTCRLVRERSFIN